MFGSFWSEIGQVRDVKILRESHDIFRRGASAVKEHNGTFRGVKRHPLLENWLVAVGVLRIGSHHASTLFAGLCSSIGGRTCSILFLFGSSQDGSLSASPSFSGDSSIAKPGGSVANSNNTPPGSRK